VMDPITLSIVGVGTLVVSGLGGFLAGRRTKIRPVRDLEKKIDEQEASIRSLNWSLESASRGNERLERHCRRVQEERDEFERIASTHDIHLIEPEKEPIRGWVSDPAYDCRRYDDNIKTNLKRIKALLNSERFKGKRVKVELRVYVSGTWTKILQNRGWSFRDKRGSMDLLEFGRLRRVFMGSGSHVFDEILTFLADPHWDLAQRTGQNHYSWRDVTSPIRFDLNVDAWEETGEVKELDLEKPKIHTVEVLRTRTELVEKIVEVPVEVEVTPDGEHAGDLNADQIAALVEVEVANQLVARGRVLPVERPGSSDTVPSTRQGVTA